MKAFAKTSLDTIELVDAPIPEIDAGELLIKVRAIGVGVHDEYFLPPNVSYPYVIGIEAAGVVEKLGDVVSGYSVGDRVAFVSAMQAKGGTWAEYAAVSKSSLVLPIPSTMTFEQAATIPVAGNTILKTFSATNLQAGDAVFIAGGSGAIGSLAIQIAVKRGYKVAASASPENHDYMKSLGVELAVDYRDDEWQQRVLEWCPDGVQAAIATQPNTANGCQPVVKDGGVVVAVSGDQFSTERGISLAQVPHMVDVHDELIDLMKQVVSGDVQLSIEKTYPFNDALEALEKVKTRHARGKIIISQP